MVQHYFIIEALNLFLYIIYKFNIFLFRNTFMILLK